jgi:AcrR family transcriptional regulator
MEDKEQNNTKNKLLMIGVKLFSEHGYEATTTRMIATHADVNTATMSFHFNNKETFYHEVLKYVANDISRIYDPIFNAIQSENAEGTLTRERAWDYITRLVDLQLHIAIDLPYPEYLTLLYWEQMTNQDTERPITEVVRKKSEMALSLLLQKYALNDDPTKALIISRSINGSMITFGEHPAFMQFISNSIDNAAPLAKIKETVSEFILGNIKNLVAPE